MIIFIKKCLRCDKGSFCCGFIGFFVGLGILWETKEKEQNFYCEGVEISCEDMV